MREPLAIVGIGCRFPGAPDVESFWRILRDGVETVQEYSEKRFRELDQVYSRASVEGGLIPSARGGFLKDLDRFDADFFGISPREAGLLDPQQRVLMEIAWEAIEDSGIPVAELAGSRTGVFVGLWGSDYESCIHARVRDVDFYTTTGGGRYPASGRLAYYFDLRGPNLTVDTACSSSLVAIHLAARSIWNEESEMALAGGVNIILTPHTTLAYGASGMLAKDGSCKFGDISADGYVRSEGAGLLLLKRLSKARSDGNPIYALIRGSATNNDGRSSGLLILPSRAAQTEVLRAALHDADIPAAALDYVEAHGTGTRAGDPVEYGAIADVLAETPRPRACAIGSVKTNLGHTEAAAGVAGVIKAALSLQHKMIPASLHLKEPNPEIPWNDRTLVLQTRTMPWPRSATERFAGVNSFGITGTNAHVILESAPPMKQESPAERTELFLLSARTAEALQFLATSWSDRLVSDDRWPASLGDLAYTAGVRRTHHDFRLAVAADSRDELLEKINGWLTKQEQPGVISGRRSAARKRRTAFVFSGYGGQWLGMGRRLMESEPVFREAIAHCDAAIYKVAGWSVAERLASMDERLLTEIDVAQPALFAMTLGLAELWRSLGVEPAAAIGHSMGEAAAATFCGSVSLDEAAAIICHRSSLMKRADGRGLMAVVEMGMEEAKQLIAGYVGAHGEQISIGANNSRYSTVLSGDATAMQDVLAKLEERGTFCRKIKIGVASHCMHMDPLRVELAERLRSLKPQTGALPMYSTTTGEIEDGGRLDADYWSRNLRQPVLFSSGIQQMLRDGFDTFIELSPDPILLQAIEEGIRDSEVDAVAIASTRRDCDERSAMLAGLGALYVDGFPLKLHRLYPQGSCLRLPTYPWQRERHWLEADDSKESPTPLQAPLTRVSTPDQEPPAVAATATRDWLYEMQWEPIRLQRKNLEGNRRWLVVGPANSLRRDLTDLLDAAGHDCELAEDAQGAKRALESQDASYHGVIRLASTIGESGPEEAVHETAEITRLVQMLGAAQRDKKPRLYLLSHGAWCLDGDAPEVAFHQAAGWGLGRIVAMEHPELQCTNIDLCACPTPEDLNLLLQWFGADAGEDQIAIRGGASLAARFSRGKESGEAARFSPNGTYLITGGMGGIGLELARWIIGRGARNVALVGRSTPSENVKKEIGNLISAGATVQTFKTDVANESEVAAMIGKLKRDMPPLRGVFHLAAAMDTALIATLEEEGLRRAIRPKVQGACRLHENTRDLNLDFFCVFSSITAVFGQRGLASYAAANAALDAFARDRQAKGFKTLSIQWGPFANLGLTGKENVRRGAGVYQEEGIRALFPDEAFSVLGTLLERNLASAIVAPIDWGKFERNVGRVPPAFRRFRSDASNSTGSGETGTAESTLGEQLVALSSGRARRSLLQSHVREILAGILKTSTSRLEPSRPLESMGLDSLMAVQFVRKLSDTTSIRLPTTAVFNYSTIYDLVSEIARRMEIPLDSDKPKNPPPPAVEKAEAPGLTEEEAIRALLEEPK